MELLHNKYGYMRMCEHQGRTHTKETFTSQALGNGFPSVKYGSLLKPSGSRMKLQLHQQTHVPL